MKKKDRIMVKNGSVIKGKNILKIRNRKRRTYNEEMTGMNRKTQGKNSQNFKTKKPQAIEINSEDTVVDNLVYMCWC